jgi:predicted  nucleic acid-binding Zn-ribbon protein
MLVSEGAGVTAAGALGGYGLLQASRALRVNDYARISPEESGLGGEADIEMTNFSEPQLLDEEIPDLFTGDAVVEIAPAEQSLLDTPIPHEAGEFGDTTEEALARQTRNLTRVLRGRLSRLPKPPPQSTESLQTATEAQQTAETAEEQAGIELQSINQEVTAANEAVATDATAVAETQAEINTAAQAAPSAEFAEGTELIEFNSSAEATTVAAQEGELAIAQGGGEVSTEGQLGQDVEAAELEAEAEGGADLAPADVGALAGDFGGLEAEAGIDSTALSFEEAAGAIEVGGGGPEDVVADVGAVGAVVVGGLVALGGFIAGLFGGNKPPSYYDINNAQTVEGDNYNKMINKLNEDKANAANSGNNKQVTVIDNYIDSLQTAKSENRAIVSYKKADGSHGIAVKLSRDQLAKAIQAYQTNPDVFKGVDPTKLGIMGLNPFMANGKSGAFKLPDGKYIPNYRYGQRFNGEMSHLPNQYLSESMTENNFFFKQTNPNSNYVFDNMEQIDQLGQSATEISARAKINYITQATQQINQASGQTKAYLTYLLDNWKYNNGVINTKPAVVARPQTAQSQQAIANYQANLANLNDRLTQDQANLSQAQQNMRQLQEQQTTAQTNQDQLTSNVLQAQQRVQQAQAQLNQEEQARATYNQNLKRSIQTSYVNSYVNAVDYARIHNTALPDYATGINPTNLYNQYSLSGTNVVPPTRNLSGITGLTFNAAGDPIFSQALQQRAANSLVTSGSVSHSSSAPVSTPATTPATTPTVQRNTYSTKFTLPTNAPSTGSTNVNQNLPARVNTNQNLNNIFGRQTAPATPAPAPAPAPPSNSIFTRHYVSNKEIVNNQPIAPAPTPAPYYSGSNAFA